MKVEEHPIIFSTESVRAIREDKKTMTRRVMKPQPELGKPWTGYCPYGQAGDRLWVKENFWIEDWLSIPLKKLQPIEYDADGNTNSLEDYTKISSRYMPRWASRILLEITELRVERLQDIIEEEAIAEGIHVVDNTNGGMYSSPNYPDIHRDIFIGLWDSLNAKRGYPWKVNPWCWCISFLILPYAIDCEETK